MSSFTCDEKNGIVKMDALCQLVQPTCTFSERMPFISHDNLFYNLTFGTNTSGPSSKNDSPQKVILPLV